MSMRDASSGFTTKEQIKQLIETYGYQRILADHNLTLWKSCLLYTSDAADE